MKTIFRALTKLFGIWLWIGAILQSVNGESITDIVAYAKPAIIEVIAFDAQNRPLKTGTGFFITADGVARDKLPCYSGCKLVDRNDQRWRIFRV